MKTFTLSIFAIATFTFYGNAQVFEDDLEYYDLGDIGLQNPAIWSTWSGIPDDGTNILIVDDFVLPNGDTQQAHIGPNSNQNVLMLLSNYTIDEYLVLIYMYIPTGSNASLNIQGETETNPSSGYEGAGNGGAGVFNSDMMYFDGTVGVSGTGVFTDFTSGDTGEFPLDQWFYLYIYFNLNNVQYQILPFSNGMTIDADPVLFQEDATLGAINFTSTDANTNYWLDYVLFIEPAVQGIDDFSATNFKLFPNPVTDILNIESAAVIDEIEVYDILGNMVLKRTPNAISPSIDMSALSSGMYLVNLTIDDNSKAFKIIK